MILRAIYFILGGQVATTVIILLARVALSVLRRVLVGFW